MNLSIKKTTRNKIVTIELETKDFSTFENQMLDQLGEPEIEFDKSYGSNPIKFKKRIRNGFKVKVRFDIGLDDSDKTSEYIDEFLEELKEKLSDAMYELSNTYNEDLRSSVETVAIRY